MTTYHIFFRNQYGEDDDYTIFRDAPLIFDQGGVYVSAYSNSFQSRKVLGDGVWPIDISDAPYAFCGTSPSEVLHPGDLIRDSMHKLVKVRPQDSGSTVSVYNNNGRPAFRPDLSVTAPLEYFGVTAENDFTEALKFVAGHSGIDSDGRPRPWATFKILPGMLYNVKPKARFYLGAFASEPGVLVDHRGNLVEIDFDAYPGLSNAIVTRKQNGQFDVKIVPAAVFAMETAITVQAAPTSNPQLTQLKHQAKLMSNLIDAALGISITDVGNIQYACTAEWSHDPAPVQKTLIALLLRTAMKTLGYTLVTSTLNPRLTMIFTNTTDLPVGIVFANWAVSIYGLPDELKGYVKNPKVQKFVSGSLLIAQPETYESPADLVWPHRPQWRCSVDWLKQLPLAFRTEVTRQLIAGMKERGYLDMSTNNKEQKLEVDFFHFEPTDLKTARADWIWSYDKLGQIVRNFVVNPQTKTLLHPDDDVTTDVAPSGLVVPSTANFLGWLEWLEGPDEDTRRDIISQLEGVLKRYGHTIGKSFDLTGVEALMITFSHNLPYDQEQARADWLRAFNSIGIGQNNYITGPLCEENKSISIPDFSSRSKYIGALRWLEGPGEKAREDIIRQLKVALQERENETQEAINIKDLLVLPFAHDAPSDLPDAQRDWLAAFASIKGNQRNFITDPFCEKDIPGHIDPLKPANNGANGVEKVEPAPAQAGVDSSQVQAPTLEAMPTSLAAQRNPQMNLSLEEKKRRALELLQREGLVGVQGINLA